MNLNINTAGNQNIGASRLAASAISEAHTAKLGGARTDFSITNAEVRSEDLEAAQIPDAALVRNDNLGQLVDRAFNLPPPPPPDFGNI